MSQNIRTVPITSTKFLKLKCLYRLKLIKKKFFYKNLEKFYENGVFRKKALLL